MDWVLFFHTVNRNQNKNNPFQFTPSIFSHTLAVSPLSSAVPATVVALFALQNNTLNVSLSCLLEQLRSTAEATQ